eukprot:s1150_g9.t1
MWLCNRRLDFLKHLREEHAPADADAAAHELDCCAGECRKRWCLEEKSGPFPVPGEQTRRGVGAYAFHQAHSRKGVEAQGRKLQSCLICARSCCLEGTDRLKLFVAPEQDAEVDVADRDEASIDDNAGEDRDKKKHGWKVHEVLNKKVQWLHRKVFDVRRHQKLWPSIPQDELLGSCMLHPSGTYEDGTSWKWLLNTKVLPSKVTSATVTFACSECVRSLTGKHPRMPKYALSLDWPLSKCFHAPRQTLVTNDVSAVIFEPSSDAENYR